MADICIVVGVLMTCYGLMQVIGALIERGQTGLIGWAVFTAVGLVALAYGFITLDVPMTSWRDIPGAFIRVLAMIGV